MVDLIESAIGEYKMAESIKSNVHNIPAHVLIEILNKRLEKGNDDPILDELIRRFETTRALITEVLNVVLCDDSEQDIISDDIIIQMEESIT